MHDHRAAAYHGKNSSDAMNKIPRSVIQQAAKKGVSIGQGTRALTLFLALNMAFPVAKPVYKHKWSCVKHYVFINLPETCFNEPRFKAKSGYAGSSLDHFYGTPKLPSRTCTLTNATLITRERYCFCTPCLTSPTLVSGDCQFTEWVGEPVNRRIEPARPVPREVTRSGAAGSLSMSQFALSLPWNNNFAAKRRLVVVRIDKTHEDYTVGRQQYWLGRPVNKSYQLTEPHFDGTRDRNGNLVSKYDVGWWVFMIRWFEYDRTNTVNGERVYKLVSKQELWHVGALVRLGFTDLHFKSCSNGEYVLTESIHNKILRYGNLQM